MRQCHGRSRARETTRRGGGSARPRRRRTDAGGPLVSFPPDSLLLAGPITWAQLDLAVSRPHAGPTGRGPARRLINNNWPKQTDPVTKRSSAPRTSASSFLLWPSRPPPFPTIFVPAPLPSRHRHAPPHRSSDDEWMRVLSTGVLASCVLPPPNVYGFVW